MPIEGFRPSQETVQPTTSPRMEQVITQLAASHEIDLSQKGASLHLDVPDQHQRWLIGHIDEQRVGVTRLQVDKEDGLAPDLDMVFAVKLEGWEPVEIIHAQAPWDKFSQSYQAQNLAVFDAQGDLPFCVFTEFWAQQIERQMMSPSTETP